MFASSSCQYFRAVDVGYKELMLFTADLLLFCGLVCWT